MTPASVRLLRPDTVHTHRVARRVFHVVVLVLLSFTSQTRVGSARHSTFTGRSGSPAKLVLCGVTNASRCRLPVEPVSLWNRDDDFHHGFSNWALSFPLLSWSPKNRAELVVWDSSSPNHNSLDPLVKPLPH
jgi:hypothetical protein